MRYFDDFPVFPISDMWTDTGIAGFASEKVYVVETSPKVVERCLLMASDPGDLVLDPTCGSRHDGDCRRTVGPPLDHHRHVPRGSGARPCAGDEREVSLLPTGRQQGMSETLSGWRAGRIG